MILPHQLEGLVDVARSRDGLSWEDDIAGVVSGRPYIFPIAAFDTAGTAYLVYATDPDSLAQVDVAAEVSRVAAIPHVYLQVSHDKGATWTPPQMLSSPDVPAIFPWIDAPGRVVIASVSRQFHPAPGQR